MASDSAVTAEPERPAELQAPGYEIFIGLLAVHLADQPGDPGPAVRAIPEADRRAHRHPHHIHLSGRLHQPSAAIASASGLLLRAARLAGPAGQPARVLQALPDLPAGPRLPADEGVWPQEHHPRLPQGSRRQRPARRRVHGPPRPRVRQHGGRLLRSDGAGREHHDRRRRRVVGIREHHHGRLRRPVPSHDRWPRLRGLRPGGRCRVVRRLCPATWPTSSCRRRSRTSRSPPSSPAPRPPTTRRCWRWSTNSRRTSPHLRARIADRAGAAETPETSG